MDAEQLRKVIDTFAKSDDLRKTLESFARTVADAQRQADASELERHGLDTLARVKATDTQARHAANALIKAAKHLRSQIAPGPKGGPKIHV